MKAYKHVITVCPTTLNNILFVLVISGHQNHSAVVYIPAYSRVPGIQFRLVGIPQWWGFRGFSSCPSKLLNSYFKPGYNCIRIFKSLHICNDHNIEQCFVQKRQIFETWRCEEGEFQYLTILICDSRLYPDEESRMLLRNVFLSRYIPEDPNPKFIFVHIKFTQKLT